MSRKATKKKRAKERARRQRAMFFFFSLSIPTLSFVHSPDTEPEPAATTARQTPMKAKTEERAIVAVKWRVFILRRRREKTRGEKKRRKEARCCQI